MLQRSYRHSSHYTASRQNIRGFTIVELLIVIVVIGILVAIAVVSFSGAQQRASFAREQSEMASIQRALGVYFTINNAYPITLGMGCQYNWCGRNQVTGNAFIPGLSPSVISTIPQMPADPNDALDAYIYQSDGKDYQLLRYKTGGLPNVEKTNNSLLATGNGYDGLAWGYKTNAAWW